jgi:hypothetical protein
MPAAPCGGSVPWLQWVTTPPGSRGRSVLVPAVIQQLLRGEADAVTPELRDLACQLWDAWWDKRPPERTLGERRKARLARRRAETEGWCPPLGLDEDELDEPGYRPYSRYRPATGTGIAGEFRPTTPRDGHRASSVTVSAVARNGGAAGQPHRLASGTLASDWPSADDRVFIDSWRVGDATGNWPSELGLAVLLSVEQTTWPTGSDDPSASSACPGDLAMCASRRPFKRPGTPCRPAGSAPPYVVTIARRASDTRWWSRTPQASHGAAVGQSSAARASRSPGAKSRRGNHGYLGPELCDGRLAVFGAPRTGQAPSAHRSR